MDKGIKLIEIIALAAGTWQAYLDRPERMADWDFDGYCTYHQLEANEWTCRTAHELSDYVQALVKRDRSAD